jgi:peptide chain release factor 2
MDAERINLIGTTLADLQARTATSGGIFDYDAKSERLRTVTAALEDPAVWNDPRRPRNWAAKRSSWKASC